MSSYNVTYETTPDWLKSPLGGDNAWQLTAATLVGLQSVPGLMVLYAGLVKRKWAINSAFMAFYGFAATLIVWVLYAYRASFGYQMLPFVGVPNQAVSMDFELSQAELPTALDLHANYGMATMIYFQFVFAAITVVITAGAFLGRMNFLAWMIYVPLWITLSYTVGAFSIWGGGFLYQLGVLDYSGGYVIHLSSGTAGAVGAFWIGPRLQRDIEDNRPNNIIMALVGAGILWLGWNGFNGGDPYTASPDAGAAVLNTNICTAFSLLVWTTLDYIYYGKPSVIGAINGMITGLVAITPAAGYVAGWGAILLAVGSGSVPWLTMNIVHKKLHLERYFDDTLGIFHTHFVAAIVGGCGTGIFATGQGVAAFALDVPGGAVDGNGRQVGLQIAGALFIIGWNLVWTSLILLFIKYVLRVPLRMKEEDLLIGDMAVHGEEPYVFSDGAAILYGDSERVHTTADIEAGVQLGKTNTAMDPDYLGAPATKHHMHHEKSGVNGGDNIKKD
uniref:High-affinity ammonium transporter n=1 Tax=Graphis scripta TaxID=71600 RepID=R4U3M9_9LECA|nr:high-affinity ammonium transporter [Graphis scripta]